MIKKLSLMKSKRFPTYSKKNLVLMKMIQIHLNYTIKSDRDHCPYTGKIREAAHSICNLRYKTPKENPVVILVLHMIIT